MCASCLIGVSTASPSQYVLSAALPFSPVRLLALIVWVYMCVYLVQYFQFSPLVPKRYKPIAYVTGLLIGPLLLFVLVTIDVSRKALSGSNGLEAIRRHFDDLRYAASTTSGALRLFDSSGKSIDQIYGHGENKRLVGSVLRLTEEIVSEAIDRRASDILIDPREKGIYTVRLRIDGVLTTVHEIPTVTCKAVLNSIKAVSNMDISEKRRPQDGAFVARKGDLNASFRVATAGTLLGEKLSIRVLNQDAGSFRLKDVGVTKKQYDLLCDAVKQPSGMILLCGPTGSGKTTTLYALLNEIDRSTRNVITVEDPIEAVLPNASQIEVNPKADITFATVLRSILRQDPDVICVGEIRDEETAEIALRAAQTGHLVFATIHCGSNAAAIIRLLDLGISPNLMASGLSLLFSQRLVRRLCDHCKREARLSNALIREFKEKDIEYSHMYDAVGCSRCNRTGYLGRTAICDPMQITDDIKIEIAENRPFMTDLRNTGAKQGKVHLRKEGLKKVAAGITSLAEIKRVVG